MIEGDACCRGVWDRYDWKWRRAPDCLKTLTYAQVAAGHPCTPCQTWARLTWMRKIQHWARLMKDRYGRN